MKFIICGPRWHTLLCCHSMWYFKRQAIYLGVTFPVFDCNVAHSRRACSRKNTDGDFAVAAKPRIFSEISKLACIFRGTWPNEWIDKLNILRGWRNWIICRLSRIPSSPWDGILRVCASILITVFIMAWSFWECFFFSIRFPLAFTTRHFNSYQKPPIRLAPKWKKINKNGLILHTIFISTSSTQYSQSSKVKPLEMEAIINEEVKGMRGRTSNL